MKSALKFSTARAAIVSALGLVAAMPANAADLGGNCCADLEERIAELEATTARKGNRKVSLEISGHVNEAIMFWDDGFESNAYQVTNDNSRTRFRFKGGAKISDGWKAGYLLEIGVRGANSKRSNQDDDTGGPDNTGLDIRHSYWFIDSKQMGKLSVGLTGGAAEGVTEINLSQTKDIAKFSDQEDSGLGMFLRSSTGGQSALSWRRLIRDNGDQAGEGRRHKLVKYDTPEFMGFVGTVNWGEDDVWEVGARYSGEFGGFKLGAGIAYGENTEEAVSGNANGFECLAQGSRVLSGSNPDCSQIGGSISVMHTSSGIYANFGAGQMTDDQITNTDRFTGVAGVDDKSQFYAVEGGIEQKWNDLGKTTLFVQYYKNEGGASARRGLAAGDAANPFAVDLRILETELESFGGGIVQGIDSAAMHLYLTYRHYEAGVTALSGTAGAGALGNVSLEDLDVVMGGAIIRF